MEIEYFDICSGVLISDVMHDLFEGVLQYETKLMLIQFIEKHYFTLKNLRSHIESLELSYGMESDKPVHIERKNLYSQGSRLNQKGSYANRTPLHNKVFSLYMFHITQLSKCGVWLGTYRCLLEATFQLLMRTG